MDIKSLVGNVEDIFNPRVTFDGYYSIGSDIFSKASKYNKDVNLVQEYLYKRYYHFVYPSFETFLKSIEIPLLFYSEPDNGYGRRLTPFVDVFLNGYIASLFEHKFSDNFDKTDNFALDYIQTENKNFLKEKKKNIIAVLNGTMDYREDKDLVNAFNSLKKPMINQLENINNFSSKEKLGVAVLKKNNNDLVRYVLWELKNHITKLLLHYDGIVKDMNKPVELNNLNELVDYDILYLRLAKIYMETIKINLKENRELPTCVLFLYKYYNALKILKTYNYTIDSSDIVFDSNKKKKYSTRDFMKEFESIVLPVNDPEIRYYQIMEQDPDTDYRSLDNINKKIAYLKEVDNSRMLAAEWDFVPKGELLEPRERATTPNKERTSKENLETREERLEKVLRRQQFLDNSPYIYKAQGKNKFDGYVAYLYSNGFVIFEKFYENQKTKLPAKTNATYVMNTDNFVEMSKLSKQEIIEYIKNGNTDVERKIHTSSWETNILNIINSSFYSKEIIEKIDRLISLGKIEERRLEKTYE